MYSNEKDRKRKIKTINTLSGYPIERLVVKATSGSVDAQVRPVFPNQSTS